MLKALLPLLLITALLSCEKDDDNNTGTSTSSKPALLLSMPDSMNTPDGLVQSPDGSILLSMPNFNDTSYPARIYKITGNTYQRFVDLPVRPDTRHVGPMDMAFGPDGNLYVNDNQFEMYDKNYKSRLLKVTMQNGNPVSVTTIVNGFRLANGLVWKGNDLYVTDSQWDMPGDTAKSAIFHFTATQLSGATIQLQPGFNNPYILDTFTTRIGPDKLDNGVDGIDYDSQGFLYTGLFGDGMMYKMILKPDGSLLRKEVFVPQGPIAAVDGFIIDRTTNNIYVTDAKTNSIKVVSPSGAVRLLWENGDTDGSDGLLDQPAEVLLTGNKLYIANFDKPASTYFVNTRYNRPNTVSVITLP